MLSNYIQKVKAWCRNNRADLITAGIIFFTGLSGFGLGRLSVDLKPNPPLSVIQPSDDPATSQHGAPEDMKKSSNNVFASRNGSVYYYPWCSGAKRVKEENKIWFPTHKEAERAGLTRASSCK